MRNGLDKVVGEIKTHFVQKLFLDNCAVYMTMWKNTVKPVRPKMTI
jgi:hypothetical protein